MIQDDAFEPPVDLFIAFWTQEDIIKILERGCMQVFDGFIAAIASEFKMRFHSSPPVYGQ